MKTVRYFVCLLVIALGAASPGELLGQTNVNFADSRLEAAILSVLQRTNGPLSTTDLMAVTNLTCWSDITNLSGLEYATNLESLSLYYGGPASLAPLVGLERLKRLDLELGWPLDCTNLALLTHLTRLDVYATALTDVGFLAGLTNLTYLDLSWNRISNVAPLAALPSLQYLDLSGNPLSSGAGLGALTNVTGSLYLDNLSLTNAGGLAGLTSLRELTLYENQLVDIAPLANLTNLVLLDLAWNQVQNYSAVAGLTKMQSLYLQGNSITNLDPLPLPPMLDTLEVSYNRISNLDALAGLTNLYWLDAHNNLLTNVVALTNFSHLAKAYLGANLLQTNAGSADMEVIQKLQSKGTRVFYEPQNEPPYVSLMTNWFVPANEPSYSSLYISDDFTSANHLQVTVQSSNTNLLTAMLDQGPPSGFPGGAQVVRMEPSVISIGAPRSVSIPALSTYVKVVPVPDQAGTAVITVIATDDTGFTSRADVAVTVAPPVSFDGRIFGAGGSNLTWRTFGQTQWTAQTNTVHAGASAAQSGSGESWLEASLTGPGTLTFWYKSDPSNSYGSEGVLFASCAASGLSGSAWMASADWRKETLSFPEGTWALRWQNYLDAYSQSASRYWVADVSFVPGPPVCWFEPPLPVTSPGYLGLVLHGPPGELYDVESSSDLHQWSKVGRVYMYNFGRWFAATNDSAAGFFRLSKVVLPAIQLELTRLDSDHTAHLGLRGEPGQPLSVEYSTDLLTWNTLLQTNNTTGLLELLDSLEPNSACRFYRAKALPWSTRVGGPGPGVPAFPGGFREHPREYPGPGPGGFPPPPAPLPGLTPITVQ